MKPEIVKYTIGLLMARKGIRTFAELAARLNISPEHLSNVIICRRKARPQQLALAKLFGLTPVELFGPFTHPDLKGASHD